MQCNSVKDKIRIIRESQFINLYYLLLLSFKYESFDQTANLLLTYWEKLEPIVQYRAAHSRARINGTGEGQADIDFFTKAVGFVWAIKPTCFINISARCIQSDRQIRVAQTLLAVFGKCLFDIAVWKPTVLAEVCRGFFRLFRNISAKHLTQVHPLFTNTLPFDTVCSEVVRKSLSKP